jgi:hypothetical protein
MWLWVRVWVGERWVRDEWCNCVDYVACADVSVAPVVTEDDCTAFLAWV